MAFMAIAKCFEMEDVAGKDVSIVVGATLDKERFKLVHDQASKAVELFVKRLEVHTSTMQEGREDLSARLPGAFTKLALSIQRPAQHLLSWDGQYLPLFSLKLMVQKDIPVSSLLPICKQ
ncbi:hypothetical protein EDB19DRAFT_1801885 [Suillus lakei]|nr:hypothetical protein EDB19DRAFT_1801885 [Suillus lakei]